MTDADLRTRLSGCTRFQQLLHVDRCPSTQDLAAEQPGGSCVVWADEQRAGRGRQGRTWWGSPGDDVEVTVRVEPVAIERPERVAAAVPIAILAALETCVARPLRFKWPNDVLADGRKLCGILIDWSGPAQGRYLIGVGVNVNRSHFPAELRDKATSLAMLTGRPLDREEVVFRLAASIDAAFDVLAVAPGSRGDRAGSYARLLRARADWFGRSVRVERAGGAPLLGEASGLDLEAVELDTRDGPVRLPLAAIAAITRSGERG
ncbi:MAG: biotin--[acetyl-CoA-carboxylase] ligase [Planctomycetes bacterium]|nr:biotin--[acetyl-CoA-carboxylase] ligase [Planctomycetota bacterium]